MGNFAPQKPKIGRIGQRAGHVDPQVNITVEMRRRKRYATRDAPFVKSCGVWTWDRHVWINIRHRRRTCLLHYSDINKCDLTTFCCLCYRYLQYVSKIGQCRLLAELRNFLNPMSAVLVYIVLSTTCMLAINEKLYLICLLH